MQGIDTHFLGIFLSRLAHRMNSIMTPVVSGPDYIAKILNSDTDGRIGEMLDLIKNSSCFASFYIEILDQLSACLECDPGTVEFRSVIKDYMSSSRYRKLLDNFPDVVLVTNTESCPSFYNGRANAIRIIIEQLIANAFETTSNHGGGFVTLDISVKEYQGGTCYLSRKIFPGSYIVLSFKDTGGGVGEEKLNGFADPCYISSLKLESGFGFSLVSLAVQQVNGHILYEQETGGSKICILLPFSNLIHPK